MPAYADSVSLFLANGIPAQEQRLGMPESVMPPTRQCSICGLLLRKRQSPVGRDPDYVRLKTAVVVGYRPAWEGLVGRDGRRSVCRPRRSRCRSLSGQVIPGGPAWTSARKRCGWYR